MKMGDGGFRPAHNVQFATTTDAARVIVGVAVSNRGSDQGEATPMIEQIEQRTGIKPTEYLVDGGYTKHEAINEATALGVTLYAPVPKPKKDQPDVRGYGYPQRQRDRRADQSLDAAAATLNS